MLALWNKLSHLGVFPGEEKIKRDVILCNKVMVVASLMILCFIPIELVMTGLILVKYEVLAVLLFGVLLFLNSKGYHTIAKYSSIIFGAVFIMFATYAVGGHSNSEFHIFPLILLPILFFRKRRHIFIVALLGAVAFFILKFTYQHVDPFFQVPLEVRQRIQPVMNIITIVFLFVELYYFKNINEQYEETLEKQKAQIEENHKHITDSINYARRIQHAILPSVESIQNSLKESFVLYLPKDVVAGDFYWMEHYDNSIYIAAADCTGHGVPGAMVSVVCSTALTRSLLEEKIKDTGKLLNRTRELVIERLSKSGEDIKDGMDISLCKIDLNKQSIQWSGANNPLYLIRKDAEEIEIIKADRQPIGVFRKMKDFTTHEIQLAEGDQFYLFTDGYADQFGGPEKSKFTYRRFRNLLLENKTQSMSNQRQILDTEFKQWKESGDETQLDDVCVIGIQM